MDNTVMEMKDDSLIMKIMFKAVAATIARGFGGKKDYENPEFRMLMNSSAGSPLRSMMISGGMKGGVMPGMLEMANGPSSGASGEYTQVLCGSPDGKSTFAFFPGSCCNETERETHSRSRCAPRLHFPPEKPAYRIQGFEGSGRDQ